MRTLALLVLAGTLGGCQTVPVVGPVVGEVVAIVSKPFTSDESAKTTETTEQTIDVKPVADPVDPIAAFAASAAPGENATLVDPESGRQLKVRAGRIFDSANGQRCRYLNLVDASWRQTREIVCSTGDAEWQRSTVVAKTAQRRKSSGAAQN